MKDSIRANRGLLAAGVATFVIMGAGQASYGPALPAFARELSLDLTRAGWLIPAHWLGCAVGVAAMYVFAARVSPRMTVALIAAGAALIGLGAGVVPTFLGAALFGIGYGMATVVFNPRILRAFAARGTAMLSLMNACFGLGAIVGPLVYVWLGAVPGRVFLVVGGLAVLVWLLAGRAGGAEAPVIPATGSATRFNPRPGFQMFAVAGIGMEATLIGLGPSALIASGESELAAARLLSAFFAAFLGARLALVFGAHLIAPFSLYLAATAAATCLAALAALLDPAVYFVGMGAAAGLLFPGFYVAASRVLGEDPRTAPTIIAAGLVGGILAPILIGAALPHLGGQGFFTLLAGVGLVTLLAGLWARNRLPALRGQDILPGE